MANPFVVDAVDTTSPFAGAGLLDDGAQLTASIKGGDWLAGGLSAAGAVGDLVSAAMNPIAALVSWGVGWLLDHLEPLKGWLNELTGNASEVSAAGATWANIAAGMQASADDLMASLTQTLADAKSQAVDAYKVLMADVSEHLGMSAQLSEAISGGLEIASGIVQFVHDLVRDAISDVVGYAVSCIIPLPNVIASVISKVYSWVNRLIGKIRELVRSFDSLQGLFTRVDSLMARLRAVLDRIRHGFLGEDAPTTRSHPGNPDVDSPTVPHGGAPGDGPSAPSSRTCTRVGEPVDAATGWVFEEHVDVQLDGTLPLVLRRRYVSGFRFGRSFGTRWASTLDEHLDTANGRLALVRWDASVLLYPPVADGEEATPLAGPDRWRLRRLDAAGYTVHDPVEGITYRFVGTGRRKWLVEQRDRAGRWIQFHRNASGLVTRVVHHGGYTIDVSASGSRVSALDLATSAGPVRLTTFDYLHGSLVAVTPGDGGTTRYEVDAVDRITAWTDANGVRYRHHYDEADRCVSQGTENPGHERVHAYAYSYSDGPEPGGSTTVVHHPSGATERYESTASGEVVTVVDPLGGITRHTFDAWGRRLSVTDPLDGMALFDYDEESRPVRTVGPDGAVTTVDYDADGLPVRVIDPTGGITTQEFDVSGELVRRVDPDGAVRTWRYEDASFTWADPTGREVLVEVDAAGLPLATTDAAGTARVVRDPAGRIVELTDPVGATTSLTWSTSGRLLARVDAVSARQTWRYDGEGNLVEAVDAAGRLTRFDYGPFDVVTRRVDPDGSVLRFDHDDQRRLVAVTNQNGLRWSYERDIAGNVLTETDYDGRATSYAYDLAGRLVERTNPAGEVTSYDLDPVGRTVGLETAGTALRLRYDRAGNLLSATGTGGDIVRELDPVGRLLSETVDGATTTWLRDEAGRVLERRTPSGVLSDWTLNATGQRSGLELAGTQVGFTLDAVGRIVQTAFAGGRIDSVYDPLGRLSGRSVSAGADAPWEAGYSYAGSGELVAVRDSAAGLRRLDVDLARRVVAVTGDRLADEVYAYDPAGNLTTAAWDPAARPGTEPAAREYRGTLLVRAGRDRFDHDAAGRVVRRGRMLLSGGVREWTYAWNGLNQLVAATTPDGGLWDYSYDALGRRTGKVYRTSDGTEVESYRYHWDGTVLAEQVHTTPATSVTTTWEHDGFTPIAEARSSRVTRRDGWSQPEVDAEFRAIVTDQVGTPLRLLSADGVTTWTSRPTLWGVTEADPAMPLRFPGQYHDAETGLFYNLNRYYDPLTGRYLTQDPLGLEPAPNPATYPANPTLEIDPLGLRACDTAKPALVIGENMQRVRRYADASGSHAYRPWKNDPWDFDLGMRRNERMIRDAVRDGRTIIDIGPDFGRRAAGRAPSPFYGMERRLTKDYDGYTRVFERTGPTSGGVPDFD